IPYRQRGEAPGAGGADIAASLGIARCTDVSPISNTRSVLFQLEHAGRGADVASALRRQLHFSRFLLLLLEGRGADKRKNSEPIRRVIEYMNRHYAEPLES